MKGDLYNLLGRTLTIAVPLLALGGFGVAIVLQMYSLALLSSYMILPMIVATAIYLLFCRDIDRDMPSTTTITSLNR